MYDYLMAIDYDNFILDQNALEDFFTEFGIAYTQFSEDDWALIFSEFDVHELAIDVSYVIDILTRVGYPLVDDLD
jgi:hypothetical protein